MANPQGTKPILTAFNCIASALKPDFHSENSQRNISREVFSREIFSLFNFHSCEIFLRNLVWRWRKLSRPISESKQTRKIELSHEDLLLLLVLYRRRKNRELKNTKRFWVRKISAQRKENGEYNSLVQETNFSKHHGEITVGSNNNTLVVSNKQNQTLSFPFPYPDTF